MQIYDKKFYKLQKFPKVATASPRLGFFYYAFTQKIGLCLKNLDAPKRILLIRPLLNVCNYTIQTLSTSLKFYTKRNN